MMIHQAAASRRCLPKKIGRPDAVERDLQRPEGDGEGAARDRRHPRRGDGDGDVEQRSRRPGRASWAASRPACAARHTRHPGEALAVAGGAKLATRKTRNSSQSIATSDRAEPPLAVPRFELGEDRDDGPVRPVPNPGGSTSRPRRRGRRSRAAAGRAAPPTRQDAGRDGAGQRPGRPAPSFSPVEVRARRVDGSHAPRGDPSADRRHRSGCAAMMPGRQPAGRTATPVSPRR